jgi:hypothetical protein
VEFVDQNITHICHSSPVYFKDSPPSVRVKPVGCFADDAYLPHYCGPRFPVIQELIKTQIPHKTEAF